MEKTIRKMSLVAKIRIRFIFFIFIIATIALIIVVFPNSNTKIAGGQHIIAHAGGAIQGHNYTNSLEAVENSIKKGIKFIELDFSITSDGILVCAHDWKTYAAQVGREFVSKIPCYSEFENSRLFSEYTPMTIHLIDSVWTANPDLYLVTDVISNFDIINRNLGKFKHRMLVECFSYEDYVLFENAGYYLPMFSFAPDNLFLLRQRIYKYRKDPNFIIPNMFVVEKQTIDKQYDGYNPIMWLENTSYAVYTAKTEMRPIGCLCQMTR